MRRNSRLFLRCLTLCAAGALLFAAGLRAQDPASSASTAQEAKGQTKKSEKKSKNSKAEAAAKPKPKPAPAPQNIDSAWGNVLQNVIPGTNAGGLIQIPQQPAPSRAAGDFLGHFFLQTRTEYWFETVSFTGDPTATGVINLPPTGTANPNGIPDPSVFQPNTNRMYSYLNWGTHGWLSNRVNTNFTFQYQQDLTHVNLGAPGQDYINTFNGNRLLALVSGYIDINGMPSDGFFRGSTLRLGRQAVYAGEDLAEFDGGSYTFNRPKFSINVYGGRRFTYFSDPEQRAIGGVNFLYRINDNSSFEYDGLFYLNGMNTFTYRRQFRNVLFSTHLRMVGSYPVEFVASSLWTPSDGKSSLTLSFRQQITNRDYIYDYTYNARDLNPNHPFVRLYLQPISPYSQVLVDYQRSFTPRIQFGGGVWIRRLNDSNDQGPFDTSFQDYHVNGRLVPWRSIVTYLGFRERDSDRASPVPASSFFDISHAGETHVRDLTFELGHGFADGRLNLRGGWFYRVLNFQDIFYTITHAHDQGILGRAEFQMNHRTQLYLDYGLDTDYLLFAPDIQHAQDLRLGVAWRY